MEDEFDDSEEGLAAREAEYERAAAVAGDLGVPPRRSAPLRASWFGGVYMYRCRGFGACLAACAAPDGPVRVLGIRRTFTGRAAAGRVLAAY